MEIEKTDKYFWVEKKNDFVKLCFDFLPETDEYIADIEETEALIKRKIELKRYCWFAGKKTMRSSSWIKKRIFFQIVVRRIFWCLWRVALE